MAVRHDIRFVRAAIQHLRVLPRRHQPAIRDAITEALRHQPDTRTRNRKPLDQPCTFGLAWELRCGADNQFRVFYEVDQAQGIVWILAVGEKIGERLYVGGEEVAL